MNKKKIIQFLLISSLIGILSVWFFVFKLPTTDWYRNFTTKKAGSITATELVKAYQTNETLSDSLYNGKIIEVSGVVKESNKTEDGKTTIILQSADSAASVTIDLKGTNKPLAIGVQATVKGMCTGFLSDVTLNEGEIIKK